MGALEYRLGVASQASWAAWNCLVWFLGISAASAFMIASGSPVSGVIGGTLLFCAFFLVPGGILAWAIGSWSMLRVLLIHVECWKAGEPIPPAPRDRATWVAPIRLAVVVLAVGSLITAVQLLALNAS